MQITRRELVGMAGLLAGAGALAREPAKPPVVSKFPQGFLWGASTAGHQIEGNNVASDLWVLENTAPTVFADRSGDCVNSFELWPVDLDLLRGLGLTAYRFSLEWARIEPEPGLFSIAMLDHYKAVIEGCRARGITPVVTFNHGTTPRWFAVQGGWSNSSSPDLFARYCERAMRHLGQQIGYAVTLNEPNVVLLIASVFPEAFRDKQRKMLEAASRATGSQKFVTILCSNAEDGEAMTRHLLAAHEKGRTAIKSVRSDLPVGVALAMTDDQAAGAESLRDSHRAKMYGPWLELAKQDDFIGVQNYNRTVWDSKGMVPPPKGAKFSTIGQEVYAPSLAGAVRYAYEATGRPILVTEHGVCTDDDTIRAELIPAALTDLKKAIDEGIPVKGYIHWTLMDNFEWFFGYGPRYGLYSVDRATFRRTPKPSATILATIAKRNSL